MATPKLAAYQAKRDFKTTREPSGEAAVAAKGRLRFVVQRHAATRLHYDLRLELDGVFKSWAVAKGPSVDPHDKRLAVEVEDHPLDYGDFEGTIPKGQYGGGTVQLWDRGYWAPEHMTAEDGLAGGDLKFTLEGERLHGSWVLVRMKNWSDGKRTNWLLIKHRDEHAREGDGDALLVDESVASGRPMAAIAAGDGRAPTPFMLAGVLAGGVHDGVTADAVWDSKTGLAAEQRSEGKSKPARRKPAGRDDQPPAPGAVRGALPEVQAPQLATLAEEPPSGAGWVSEIKFDGYRLLASIADGKVRLLTRNGHDWADRMPAVARAFAGLKIGSAMFDGELVWLQPDGVSSFPGLQAALKAGRDGSLTFFAFDLLHLEGWDLRGCSLIERKRVLAGVCDWSGMLRYSDHHVGQTDAMRRNACQMHLEGIICKQADAAYEAGRGRGWLKLKCSGREEFVLLGWTPPAKSRVGIGALHVGYYDPEGRLHYAGGVGSGFDDKELKAIRTRLDGMAADAPGGMLVSGDPIDGGGELGAAGHGGGGAVHRVVRCGAGAARGVSGDTGGQGRGRGGARRGGRGGHTGGVRGGQGQGAGGWSEEMAWRGAADSQGGCAGADEGRCGGGGAGAEEGRGSGGGGFDHASGPGVVAGDQQARPGGVLAGGGGGGAAGDCASAAVDPAVSGGDRGAGAVLPEERARDHAGGDPRGVGAEAALPGDRRCAGAGGDGADVGDRTA